MISERITCTMNNKEICRYLFLLWNCRCIQTRIPFCEYFHPIAPYTFFPIVLSQDYWSSEVSFFSLMVVWLYACTVYMWEIFMIFFVSFSFDTWHCDSIILTRKFFKKVDMIFTLKLDIFGKINPNSLKILALED